MHRRTWQQIFDRPHICRWRGVDDNGMPIAMWAVHYLLGGQSRIRCVLHHELPNAIRDARRVANYNKAPWVQWRREQLRRST